MISSFLTEQNKTKANTFHPTQRINICDMHATYCFFGTNVHFSVENGSSKKRSEKIMVYIRLQNCWCILRATCEIRQIPNNYLLLRTRIYLYEREIGKLTRPSNRIENIWKEKHLKNYWNKHNLERKAPNTDHPQFSHKLQWTCSSHLKSCNPKMINSDQWKPT